MVVNLLNMNENKLRRLFPNASLEFIKSNSGPEDNGVCASKQEQPKRKSLERVTQGEVPSVSRYAIHFRIYSQRPLDWDNYWTKCIQDILVQIGAIHDDAWNVLQGSVKSEKAHSKEEERTEIIIEQLV